MVIVVPCPLFSKHLNLQRVLFFFSPQVMDATWWMTLTWKNFPHWWMRCYLVLLIMVLVYSLSLSLSTQSKYDKPMTVQTMGRLLLCRIFFFFFSLITNNARLLFQIKTTCFLLCWDKRNMIIFKHTQKGIFESKNTNTIKKFVERQKT